jgi:hypothetical protein
MRLSFRKPKTQRLPTPPNPITIAITRWIDGKKRQLAAALSRREQRLTVRQKKQALALFSCLGATLFLFNLYRGLVVDVHTVRGGQDYVHLPADLPSNAAPFVHLHRPSGDSISTINPPDTIR